MNIEVKRMLTCALCKRASEGWHLGEEPAQRRLQVLVRLREPNATIIIAAQGSGQWPEQDLDHPALRSTGILCGEMYRVCRCWLESLDVNVALGHCWNKA